MTTFAEFVSQLESMAGHGRQLQRRLADLDRDGRPPTELMRSSLFTAADDVAQAYKRGRPWDEMPNDVIDEEWDERELVLVRNAVETLGLVVDQRPETRQDEWRRDVALALEEFFLAKAAFDRSVEF